MSTTRYQPVSPNPLATPLQQLRGVGPHIAEKLEKLAFPTLKALFTPFLYVTKTAVISVKSPNFMIKASRYLQERFSLRVNPKPLAVEKNFMKLSSAMAQVSFP